MCSTKYRGIYSRGTGCYSIGTAHAISVIPQEQAIVPQEQALRAVCSWGTKFVAVEQRFVPYE